MCVSNWRSLILQFHLLPIRDWNSSQEHEMPISRPYCNFTYSLLGIETNLILNRWIFGVQKLQFHLLPIRDWNKFLYQIMPPHVIPLQFHLLPIRDWNSPSFADCYQHIANNCNFTYSLLGIETRLGSPFDVEGVLQFHLLPIRDWNRL